MFVVHAPVQHSPADMHDCPLGLHEAPQTPLLQTPVQQSANPTHVAPSGLQPHVPLTHLFVQHSAADMHGPPSGVQRIGPQVLLLH